MRDWKPGQFVTLDGRLAVIVATDAGPDVPEGHLALWFGPPAPESTGEVYSPEVWTVPTEYCQECPPPHFRH